MSQIHPNVQIDCIHKPKGLFAKILESANKIKLLVLLLSYILIIFEALLSYWNQKKIENFWRVVVACSYTVICLYLILKRQSYKRFINYYSRQIAIYSRNESTRKFISKHRIIGSIGYPFFVTLYTLYGISYGIQIYHESQSYYETVIDSTWIIMKSMIYMNRYVIIQFIVECCLHVQICFKIVDDQIEYLKQSEHPLNLEHLQMVRHLYDVAIKKTRKLDSLLFWILPLYYCSCILNLQMFLHLMIYEYNNNFLKLIVREIFLLLITTYYIAKINGMANSAFNQVYSISYKVKSRDIQDEMRFFFVRILKNDVGLTILKIVLITPGFVTSFGTLSLTITLAILGIFK